MSFDIPQMVRELRAAGLLVVVIDEHTDFPPDVADFTPGFFGTAIRRVK